jgi:hypothetical protein
MRRMGSVFLALSLLAATPAFGQAADAPQSQPEAQPPSEGTAPKRGEKPKDKTINLGPIRVTGQVRKPEAFYILQRSPLVYPEAQQKKSFLGKVVESVEKESSL